MEKKPLPRSEAGRRYAERREHEEEAPRLRDRVPALATLRLEVTDGRSIQSADPKHTRIIMVDTAPALFSLMCGDHGCRDGGHDVTHTVLGELRNGATRFEVRDVCYGSVGSAQCGRTMLVEVTATYR